MKKIMVLTMVLLLTMCIFISSAYAIIDTQEQVFEQPSYLIARNNQNNYSYVIYSSQPMNVFKDGDYLTILVTNGATLQLTEWNAEGVKQGEWTVSSLIGWRTYTDISFVYNTMPITNGDGGSSLIQSNPYITYDFSVDGLGITVSGLHENTNYQVTATGNGLTVNKNVQTNTNTSVTWLFAEFSEKLTTGQYGFSLYEKPSLMQSTLVYTEAMSITVPEVPMYRFDLKLTNFEQMEHLEINALKTAPVFRFKVTNADGTLDLKNAYLKFYRNTTNGNKTLWTPHKYFYIDSNNNTGQHDQFMTTDYSYQYGNLKDDDGYVYVIADPSIFRFDGSVDEKIRVEAIYKYNGRSYSTSNLYIDLDTDEVEISDDGTYPVVDSNDDETILTPGDYGDFEMDMDTDVSGIISTGQEFVTNIIPAFTLIGGILNFLPPPIPQIITVFMILAIGFFIIRLVRG